MSDFTFTIKVLIYNYDMCHAGETIVNGQERAQLQNCRNIEHTRPILLVDLTGGLYLSSLFWFGLKVFLVEEN